MITVRIDTQQAVLYFENLLAQARRPAGILLVAGRAVANLLKRHYRGRDRAEPNKLGGPRTHFWREVADSVQAPVVEGAVMAATEASGGAILDAVRRTAEELSPT